VAVSALPGCFLKKKGKVAAAPVPPPAIAQPQPEATPPPPAGEPNRSEPAPPPKLAAEDTEATAQPPAKPKTTHPHTPRKTTPPPAAPVKAEETKPAPNPPSGQLTASLSHDEALHQKLTTQQLLDATESNLKSISRALSADEQAMVAHIRSYMQQSTKATSDGDFERAYNLALKAHLLSDDLVKH